MHCEFEDPHCEGPISASDPRWENPDGTSRVGSGEPMTVVSISLFNLLHPRGYRPPKQLLALASAPATRVVTSRFLAQNVTANGNQAKFAELYNFVTPHFAIGSASQEYITNTHSKYYPNVESKLLNILQPDRVYFGQKDGLQCIVIANLIEGLNFPTELVVGETVRPAPPPPLPP